MGTNASFPNTSLGIKRDSSETVNNISVALLQYAQRCKCRGNTKSPPPKKVKLKLKF